MDNFANPVTGGYTRRDASTQSGKIPESAAELRLGERRVGDRRAADNRGGERRVGDTSFQDRPVQWQSAAAEADNPVPGSIAYVRRALHDDHNIQADDTSSAAVLKKAIIDKAINQAWPQRSEKSLLSRDRFVRLRISANIALENRKLAEEELKLVPAKFIEWAKQNHLRPLAISG